MLIDKYLECFNTLVGKVTTTQRVKMEQVADVIVSTVKNKGNVHIFDTGHIINNEMINRAGGLYLLKPLKYTFSVDNPATIRVNEKKDKSTEGLAEYLIKASNVMAGDVLILGSVSGKTPAVIDLSIAAKKLGVTTVAITSIEYSSQVESDHSSKKRLFEICDIVLDNCAPYGDAMMEIEGVKNKAFPASGIASTLMMWCICADVIEKLLKLNLEPSVFMSINGPEGVADYERLKKHDEEFGY